MQITSKPISNYYTSITPLYDEIKKDLDKRLSILESKIEGFPKDKRAAMYSKINSLRAELLNDTIMCSFTSSAEDIKNYGIKSHEKIAAFAHDFLNEVQKYKNESNGVNQDVARYDVRVAKAISMKVNPGLPDDINKFLADHKGAIIGADIGASIGNPVGQYLLNNAAERAKKVVELTAKSKQNTAKNYKSLVELQKNLEFSAAQEKFKFVEETIIDLEQFKKSTKPSQDLVKNGAEKLAKAELEKNAAVDTLALARKKATDASLKAAKGRPLVHRLAGAVIGGGIGFVVDTIIDSKPAY
ncbi:MAG: hypothetical protein JHC93_05805 [Parachlamydiales bacterium]|nr:hypothetical protein [Parachlamydiales bacterium]